MFGCNNEYILSVSLSCMLYLVILAIENRSITMVQCIFEALLHQKKIELIITIHKLRYDLNQSSIEKQYILILPFYLIYQHIINIYLKKWVLTP